MVQITYRIVEHDGGWAYKVGDTFSETFTDHDSARAAAVAASREQKVPDEDTLIEYADPSGIGSRSAPTATTGPRSRSKARSEPRHTGQA